MKIIPTTERPVTQGESPVDACSPAQRELTPLELAAKLYNDARMEAAEVEKERQAIALLDAMNTARIDEQWKVVRERENELTKLAGADALAAWEKISPGPFRVR